MKLFGLTPGQFLTALLLGLLVAFIVVFATTPHPVSVPVQVITPVPTPPPVVITQQPSVQQSGDLTVVTLVDPLSETILTIMDLMVAMWWFIIPALVIWFILQVHLFKRRDDYWR